MKLDLNKFLLFGDSITEYSYNIQPYLLNPLLAKTASGYEFALGPALTNAYARRLDVIQRGWGGYTSRTAKAILPLILKSDHDIQPESKKIKIAYVFFGTNDASQEGAQFVPLKEYESNIRFITKELLARNIKVILVSSAYHDATVWESLPGYTPESGHRSNENNAKYREVLAELAVELNVAFLDLYKEFTAYALTIGVKPEALLVDGIHFNGKGYEAFYKGLIKTIEANYPEWAPSNLDINLRLWRETINDDFYAELQELASSS